MVNKRIAIARTVIIAVTSIVATLFVLPSKAQTEPYFAHYFDMQTSFNPAAAGKEARINVYGAYAMTMAGFENAPQTMFFAGDMPFAALGAIHGVGLQMQNDNIGLFTHQRLSGQYAVRKTFGRSNLSIGVQPGVVTEKFRGSDADIIDSGDDAISTSDVNGNSFDLGVGVLFQRDNWYAGISAQHLTSPTIMMGEKNEISLAAYYYATGGITFQLRNPLLSVATSTFLLSEGQTYRADITGRVIYNYDGRQIYAGASYSVAKSVTLLVGGTFNGFKVGYSFEGYTSDLGFRNGSHELFIGYQMDVDLGKKGKNRHQTTRTL